MGIIGSILGRREPEVAYRTIDGGHPAPYPDMTDEQLYNYEMTFNVPHKTFDKPPHGAPLAHTEYPETLVRQEPHLPQGPEPQQTRTARPHVFDAPRYTTPPAPGKAGGPPAAIDFSRPVRLITTKQPVDIITTRARHPIYKVHGYIGDDDVVTVFTIDGKLSEHGLPYLENVPQMEQLYLNIYLNRDGLSTDRYVVTQHATQEEADAAAAASAAKDKGERLTCVAVQLDV